MAGEPINRKRRRFSFSLRTLMIVMLLFGALLAPIVAKRHRYQQELAVVNAIYNSGGNVSGNGKYDFSFRFRHIFGDDLFDEITFVRLGKSSDSVTPLTGMTGMEYLNLMDTKVVDLSPLAGMTRLTSLDLTNTPVSDLSPLVWTKSVTIYLDESQKVNVPQELAGRVRRR